jgi:hypothetical protein
MESLKHRQFTEKAPGTKRMKKLIQLCSLHFLVHESKVEGACSVAKKMCMQFKCNPLFFGLATAASSVSIPKRIQHPLATTLQIADFTEATFYISGECFQISFGKWPKEPREKIRTICTTSLLRKNDL